MDSTLPVQFAASAASGFDERVSTREKKREGEPATAWLVPYKLGRRVALPMHATIAILDPPPMVVVPGASYYCKSMFRWRGHWLPLLDLEVLLTAYRSERVPPTRHVLIVAYQRESGQLVQHGAISLPAMPVIVRVSDSAQCQLPTDSDLWPVIALSCFQHAGRAVPILDTGRLFDRYHG